jgi:HEAT repeat protein
MAAIRELACLERRAADLLHLPPNIQPAIGRWLLPTGLPTECKIDALLHVLYRGESAARTAVAWSFTRCNDEATMPVLRNLTSDANPDVRRLATYELARRRPWEFPVADLLAPGTSADTSPQRPLPDRGMTFERYWASFDRLNNNERITAGRDMLDVHPDATRAIRLRLNEPEPASRIRALSIIRTLELAETFADDLFRLCHDPNPEIRSNVISVLSTSPGGTARRIFHAALSDQNPRVRANAVEAIERIGDQDLTDLLLPMLGSPDNRVRANAVKALLKQGVRPAAETLLKMLDDPDRAQRISALWLVEQMGLLAMAARISRIAACDQDPAVRLRAQRLIQHLGQQITAPLAPEPETQRDKEVAAL